MFKTHLRLQSEYSLLESTLRLKDIPALLKEKGYRSAALCDTEAMYASLPFFLEMKKAGLQPILGVSLFLSPQTHTVKAHTIFPKISLLAETNQGLKNLHHLVSLAHLEYKNQGIPYEVLKEHREGLILLTGDLESDLGQLLLKGEEQQARQRIQWYLEHFGKKYFFVEVQQQGLPEEAELFRQYLTLKKSLDFSFVATQRALYDQASESEGAELLRCIRTGEKWNSSKQVQTKADYHLFSASKMEEDFKYYPECLAQAEEIARRCQAEYELDQLHLPQFKFPKGFTYESTEVFLEKLAFSGLKKRLPHLTADQLPLYEERLKNELNVLKRMGFVDYFLIVADFIAFARKKGIPVGPGRGSGAASLVAYCTGITSIDPLAYDLIFERFLNEDRVSLPDFDIDICYERRQEVIDYVYKKYGTDKVCQVITFGTLAPRAALRDVARILDYPLALVNQVCQEVPALPHTTLEKALSENKTLRHLYESKAEVKRWVDLTRKIEGLPRHSSTHAAGLVISPIPLMNLCPLSKNGEVIVTQFEKDYLERIGLLKFDFLGLRTLTVIEETKQRIQQDYGLELDLYSLSYNDPKVFEKLSKGETEGVFQLESKGMVHFLKNLKPTHLEDIIAGTSLFRPGPMEQIPRYVQARHHQQAIQYHHPLLEPILRSTYGCIVYQEQVMRIVRDLAGFSMAQADLVRRAMSKKKPEELAHYEKLFLYGGLDEKGQQVKGCLANGVSEKIGRIIFAEVLAFAGYAFNKPHAAAYAHLIYQTAFLKTYYPVQFYTALLNAFIGNQKQAAHYVHTARQDGILILPLDINQSQIKYSTEKVDSQQTTTRFGIRMGLEAVKFLSLSYLEKIKTEQEQGVFLSLEDFLKRSASLTFAQKQTETLAMAGAFDRFLPSRKALVHHIQHFFEHRSAKHQAVYGQLSLFENPSTPQNLPVLAEESLSERLNFEKELLGFYVTGHPLQAFKRFQEALRQGKQSESHRTVLGLLRHIKKIQTKKGETMAFLLLETEQDTLDLTLFPRLYSRYAPYLQKDSVFIVSGTRTQAQEQEEGNKESLLVQSLCPLHRSLHNIHAASPKIVFKVKADRQLNDLKPLLQLLENHRGSVPCYLELEKTGKQELLPCQYWIHAEIESGTTQVKLSPSLKEALKQASFDFY